MCAFSVLRIFKKIFFTAGITTCFGLDDQASIYGRIRDFFFLFHNVVQAGCGARPVSYPMFGYHSPCSAIIVYSVYLYSAHNFVA
jgi:hypothetical protein